MAKKIIEDKRISSRKRKIILRKWLSVLWILLVVGLFVAAILGMNYFYNSDYFKVKKIEIKGNSFYKKEDIADKVKDLTGTNIFEIDKKKYEDNLINSFARLKKAEILKVFPDSLTINVVERTPLLIVLYKNSYFLVDNEGVILEKIADDLKNYKGYLIAKDVVEFVPEIGQKIAKKNVLSSAEIYRYLSEDIKRKIKFAGIFNDAEGNIFFETIDGKVIIYGNSNEIIKKNTILEQIFKDLQNENINYSIIDLRVTDNPVIK
ncbi:FtsQ-type POTRA domain-containing protein [bacterium]|nr:FtsQ-type POTRA domain-containing protein [bacterium]